MHRRAVLRAGAGLAGLGAAGRAGAHPPPETPPNGTATAASDGFAPLGRASVPGATEAVVGDDGTSVYVATGDGFAAVDVSDPADPTVTATRRSLLADRAGGPLSGIQDVKTDGDRLLVVGPAHEQSGVSAAVVYDVSTPADPALVTVHETSFPIHNAFVESGVAYLTGNDGDRNPLVMVDVTGTPREVGRWSPLDADGAWADVPAALRPLHDVVVQDGVAYLAYWDAGTWLLDVRDPAAPAVVGHVAQQSPADLSEVEDTERAGLELPGNSHAVAVAEDGAAMAVGREAWDADGDGAGGPGGIDYYDLADPTAPERTAHVPPLATGDASREGTWTTAHNFDLSAGRLYAAWYRGGVSVHDLSGSAPAELARWRAGDQAAFWAARRARDCVVASSFRGTEGVYTFPDPAPETTQTTTPPGTVATGGVTGVALAALAGVALGAAAWARRRD